MSIFSKTGFGWSSSSLYPKGWFNTCQFSRQFSCHRLSKESTAIGTACLPPIMSVAHTVTISDKNQALMKVQVERDSSWVRQADQQTCRGYSLTSFQGDIQFPGTSWDPTNSQSNKVVTKDSEAHLSVRGVSGVLYSTWYTYGDVYFPFAYGVFMVTILHEALHPLLGMIHLVT